MLGTLKSITCSMRWATGEGLSTSLTLRLEWKCQQHSTLQGLITDQPHTHTHTHTQTHTPPWSDSIELYSLDSYLTFPITHYNHCLFLHIHFRYLNGHSNLYFKSRVKEIIIVLLNQAGSNKDKLHREKWIPDYRGLWYFEHFEVLLRDFWFDLRKNFILST